MPLHGDKDRLMDLNFYFLEEEMIDGALMRRALRVLFTNRSRVRRRAGAEKFRYRTATTRLLEKLLVLYEPAGRRTLPGFSGTVLGAKKSSQGYAFSMGCDIF